MTTKVLHHWLKDIDPASYEADYFKKWTAAIDKWEASKEHILSFKAVPITLNGTTVAMFLTLECIEEQQE